MYKNNNITEDIENTLEQVDSVDINVINPYEIQTDNIQDTSIQDIVNNSSGSDNVQDTSIQDIVYNSPITDNTQDTTIQDIVNNSSSSDSMQDTTIQDILSKLPYTEPINIHIEDTTQTEVIPKTEEISTSLWLADVATAPLNGISKTINNGIIDPLNGVLNLSEAISNYAIDVWNKGLDEAEWNWKSIKERSLIPELYTREQLTGIGEAVSTLSQIASSLYGAGMAMRAGNILQGTASTAERLIAQGSMADLLGFSKEDGNLSTTLKNSFGIDNEMLKYLVIEADDSEFTARMKNMAEGSMLGALVDNTLIPILKTLRSVAVAPSKGAVRDALNAYVDTVDKQTIEKVNQLTKQSDKTVSNTVQPVTKNSSETSTDIPTSTLNKSKEIPLSTKTFKEVIDNAGTAEQAIERITNTMNLKRMVFDSPQASNMVMELGEKLFDKTLKGQGVEHHAKVFADIVEEAKRLGDDMTGVIVRANNDTELISNIGRRLGVAKNMYHVMTEEAIKVAKKIDTGFYTDEDLAHFLTLSENVQNTHRYIADLRTSFGRSLALGKMKITKKTAKEVFEASKQKLNQQWVNTSGVSDNLSAQKWLEEKGVVNTEQKQNVVNMARQLLLSDSLETKVKNMDIKKDTKGNFIIKGASELFINNLLSSPATHGFNALTSFIKLFDSPTAKILGGGIKGDFKEAARGSRELVGLVLFAKDALKLGYQALKLNDNILLKDAGRVLDNNANYKTLSSEGYKQSAFYKEGSEKHDVIGLIFEVLGKATGLPSRLLMSSDEIFKQLSFRSTAYADLYIEGTEKGLKDKALADYVEEGFQKYLTSDGRAIINNETAYAVRKAKEATWSQDLKGMGLSLQRMTNEHPLLRFFTPFIRTPFNVMIDAYDHSPLGFMNLLKEGASSTDKAEQLGRNILGGMTISFAYLLYENGLITGSAPNNPKEREAFFSAGNQEYSIKVSEKYWVSYNRLDPVATLISTAVDLFALNDINNHFYNEEKQMSEYAKILQSIVNNISSKTYFSGLNDLVDGLSGEQRAFDIIPRKIAVNTSVPYSGFFRFIRNQIDPVSRARESIQDEFMNTIPFLSTKLPARIDHVTGKAKYGRGYVFNEIKRDKVLEELNKMSGNILGEPTKYSITGVILNAEQLERLKYHEATIKRNGQTKYEKLKEFMETDRYKKTGYAIKGLQGYKEKRVNKITNRYRDKAIKELFKEYPELKQKVNEYKKVNKLSMQDKINKNSTSEEIKNLLYPTESSL